MELRASWWSVHLYFRVALHWAERNCCFLPSTHLDRPNFHCQWFPPCFFPTDEQNKGAWTDIPNRADKEVCAMHSMKQNGGKQKQEVVAGEAKWGEVFQTHRGQEGSRGVGEVPRQQKWLWERCYKHTHQIIQIIQISSPPMDLGHIIQTGAVAPQLLWGHRGSADASSTPSRRFCPSSGENFALFLILSRLRNRGKSWDHWWCPHIPFLN